MHTNILLNYPFSVELGETLFAGYFNPVLNTTLPRRYESCSCGGRKSAHVSCLPKIGCFDAPNSKRHLMTTLGLGKSKDFKAFTNLVLESAEVVEDDDLIKEEGVGHIMLSETLPIQEAPEDGWTMNSADKYCGKSLRSTPAATSCVHVPDIDLTTLVASCRNDLIHSGDSRVAGLHLERMAQECRDTIFRNASMWTRDEMGQAFDRPKKSLTDNLCLNGCSESGECERGFCKCHDDYVGSDCSQAVTSRVGVHDPPTAPPVFALANRGLCDVRARPCRDLVVLGEGLVRHESLTCVFEIYKVRSIILTFKVGKHLFIFTPFTDPWRRFQAPGQL
jgi:hypothetical protein